MIVFQKLQPAPLHGPGLVADLKGESDHILEALERAQLDDVLGRFGGNVHHFAGFEGVGDTLLGLLGGLLDLDDLEQAGQRDLAGAVTSDLFLDDDADCIPDFTDLLLGQTGLVRKFLEKLGFGERLLVWHVPTPCTGTSGGKTSLCPIIRPVCRL